MFSRRHYLARLITVRYLMGLVAIALMVTASFIMVGITAKVESEGYRVVGLASEQRVASQRIPFLATAYVNAGDDEMRGAYRAELARAVNELANRHKILSLRNGQPVQIPAGMRDILRAVYLNKWQPFVDQVDHFIESANTVLAAEEDELHDAMPALVRLNLAGGGYVLHTHGLLSRMLRQEAIAAIDRIRALNMALWLATLALLAAEIPLIFHPMVRQASTMFEQIQAARRKAEQDAAAAEAARRGQASFIRTMSHELRTPLNAILGMNQLSRMLGLSAKQDEYAQDIDNAGRHLLGLIDDVLEFGRLEAKQVTILNRRTLITRELESVQSLLQPLATRKELEFSCRVGPGLSDQYMTDGLRLRQILLNLAGNAIKFTDHGSVAVQALLIGAPEPGVDLVRFEVMDTGIGVPAEARERIFEEFQQTDTSLARKYGGSGLGLAICGRLVALMNGEIGVQANGSKGSIFWVTLPLKRAGPRDVTDESPFGNALYHGENDRMRG